MSVRLIGHLDRTFDNFLTLRGSARMGDLEKISKADSGYQRKLYTEHGEAMEEFLKGGKYTFYPELILSAILDRDNTLEEKVSVFYESIGGNKTIRKNKFTNFSLRALLKKWPSSQDIRGAERFFTGILEIEDNEGKIFDRIDGNHRLNATQRAKKENEIVPFCVIFFRNEEEAKKTTRILFTNINYKHLPLTTEENYRLILDPYDEDQYLYTDEELKNPIWFGEHFVLARKFLKELSLNNLPNIQNILQKDNGTDLYTRTVLVEFFEILLKHNKSIDNKKLKCAFREIERCYETYSSDAYENYQLLIVHLYFYYEGSLSIFSNWVLKNCIYELKSVDTNSLINVYESILESQKRTIFLAMDFRTSATQNLNAIRGAVCDVNKEPSMSPKLKLKLLRIDEHREGHSYAISDKILQQIEEKGYLIADLSLGNKNVYHEVGYLMGLNRGQKQKQENFLLVHNQSIENADFNQDVAFNISNLSVVNAKDSNDLRNRVKEQIKIYYNLVCEDEV